MLIEITTIKKLIEITPIKKLMKITAMKNLIEITPIKKLTEITPNSHLMGLLRNQTTALVLKPSDNEAFQERGQERPEIESWRTSKKSKKRVFCKTVFIHQSSLTA